MLVDPGIWTADTKLCLSKHHNQMSLAMSFQAGLILPLCNLMKQQHKHMCPNTNETSNDKSHASERNVVTEEIAPLHIFTWPNSRYNGLRALSLSLDLTFLTELWEIKL